MKIRDAESILYEHRQYLIEFGGSIPYNKRFINALTFALYLIDKEQAKRNGIREAPDYDFDLEE